MDIDETVEEVLFDVKEFFSYYRDLTPSDQNLEPRKYFTSGPTVTIPREIKSRKVIKGLKASRVVERFETPSVEFSKEPTSRLVGLI